ncbi:MAG: Lrp/AsnC family transcriptional regulator [Burkholderiales bacterium]|nr:Lrp/AsnC family transcriptional regulator [Burkholderiales bacterium]
MSARADPAAPAQAPAALRFRLLNEHQRGFPLVDAPYAAVAQRLEVSEEAVLAVLARCLADGTIARVGAVIAPHSVGVSTLAALRVREDDLERVAALVSARREVSHNYARDGDPNLWFVLNAADPATLGQAMDEIERAAASGPVLNFPLLEEYRIDLGFDMRGPAQASEQPAWRRAPCPLPLTLAERALLGALESGLALTRHPYRELAAQAGMTGEQVVDTLRDWVQAGVIRRLGVIVRHREMGYRANAMAVWDVPDGQVGAFGRALAACPGVTLCYRRERSLPDWPFNLYCMVHGREPGAVRSTLAGNARACALEGFPARVLFGRTRFKQQGARYFPEMQHARPHA